MTAITSAQAYPGCGFLATIEQPSPRPYRAYRLLPDQIAHLSAAVAGQRPVLDGPSALAAGDVYDTRWNRAGALLANDTASPQNQEEDVHDDGHVLPPAKDPEQVLRDAATADRRLREAIAEHRGEVFDPDVDEQFREIVAGTVVWSDPSTWPTADSSTAGRTRLVEIVDLAGTSGIMFATLQEYLHAGGPVAAVETAAGPVAWAGLARRNRRRNRLVGHAPGRLGGPACDRSRVRAAARRRAVVRAVAGGTVGGEAPAG